MYKLSFWSNVKSFLTGDLNQKWLAKKVGISPSNLSMMITRNTIPKADIAFKISEVLGVSMAALFSNESFSSYTDEVGEHDFSLFLEKEVPSYLIPLTSTHVKYKEESEILSSKNFIGSIRILKDMAKGFNPTDLIGVHVKGDEMIGVQLFEHDIVIFAKEHRSSNGLYAIAIGSGIFVRRLEFMMLKNEVSIMSENPRYTTITTKLDDPQLTILGSVVGWVHVHHFNR